MDINKLLKQINPSSYLSIDNGNGILLSKEDVQTLEKYHINFYTCHSISELLMLIEETIDETTTDDEELESIITKLEEIHYYNETNK